MRLGRSVGVACVPLLLAAGASGCSSNACTAIGAESGVVVRLTGSGWKTPLDLEVCVAERCVSTASVASTTEPAFVGISGLATGRAADVLVTVRTHGDPAPVAVSRSTVTPEVFRPNGETCDPAVPVASVSVGSPA